RGVIGYAFGEIAFGAEGGIERVEINIVDDDVPDLAGDDVLAGGGAAVQGPEGRVLIGGSVVVHGMNTRADGVEDVIAVLDDGALAELAQIDGVGSGAVERDVVNRAGRVGLGEIRFHRPHVGSWPGIDGDRFRDAGDAESAEVKVDGLVECDLQLFDDRILSFE